MIRVFPSKNNWTPDDGLAYVGDPPLFRPPDLPVRISVTFSWDIPEGERLFDSWKQYYTDVRIGGPALGDPGGEFTPGLFVKEGVTITSRGCPRTCPWCVVPEREGKIRELEVKPGWIVQDNNLLACSEGHIGKVFEMLRGQRHPVKFSGGLDPRLLEPWHVDLFLSIKVDELWFSCDSPAAVKALKWARRLLGDRFRKDQLRCYALVGFYDWDTPKLAEERLIEIYRMGFIPFSMVYRIGGSVIPKEWSLLANRWTRPAKYKSHKNC